MIMNHFGMISEINVNIYEKAQTICPTLTKVNNISILLKKNPVRISNSNNFLSLIKFLTGSIQRRFKSSFIF